MPEFVYRPEDRGPYSYCAIHLACASLQGQRYALVRAVPDEANQERQDEKKVIESISPGTCNVYAYLA